MILIPLKLIKIDFRILKFSCMSEDQRRTFELGKFKAWCDEHGIKAPLGDLRYSGPDAGYGLFAKTTIRNNELVIEVRCRSRRKWRQFLDAV